MSPDTALLGQTAFLMASSLTTGHERELAVFKGLPWVIFSVSLSVLIDPASAATWQGSRGSRARCSGGIPWSQGAAAIPQCLSALRPSRPGSAGLCPLSPCRWRQCRGGCRGKPRARPASGTAPAPTARCRWPPATGRCSGSAGTRSTAWTMSSRTPPRSPCGCC